MHYYQHAYIDGASRDFAPRSSLTLQDSFTEQPLAEVALAGEGEACAAVTAAKLAFDSWSRTPVAERAAALRRIGALLAQEGDILAEAITREVGMPFKLSRRIQVQGPVAAWATYADLAERFNFSSKIGHSVVTQEAAGVVACITPWNYPLHQITAKVAPALAAGCTVVLKPSELAPAAAFALVRAAAAAGLPRGVFNMVMGEGAVVGETLAAHADVDMVSFTGSTAAGRRVASVAGAGIKRVALELGGKSASVVLPDADLPLAMRHALGACFLNSGQTCTATTRLLVPATHYKTCVQLLRQGIAGYVMGDPMAPATTLGPLLSAQQRERVLGYIDAALAEGAELIAGGRDASEQPSAGYFVPPTVLGNVGAHARIAQEEVFGPVLTLMTYESLEDAIAIANGTVYGLAAAVWSSDPQQAMAVASRLRAGQVDINGARFNPLAPFGGFKQSGVGRENGVAGLEEFVEPRAIQLPA
ncbi:aldehyde dehydrogenase family protein [Cupriavidus basilensis]